MNKNIFEVIIASSGGKIPHCFERKMQPTAIQGVK
jgi:hypothetical protein